MNLIKSVIFLLATFSMLGSVALAQDYEKLKINGFLTSAYAVTDSEVAYDQDRVDENGSYYAYSRYGVQFQYEVNPDVNLMIQMHARGSDTGENFDVNTNWAMINYRLSDQFSVQTGKIKSNIFALSEQAEVGYALPWINPPQVLYANDTASAPGTQFTYESELGDDWNLTVQLAHIVANYNVVVMDAAFDSRQNSFIVALQGDELLARMSYASFTNDITKTAGDIQVLIEDVGVTYMNGALIYDSEFLMAMVEYGQVTIDAIGVGDIVLREKNESPRYWATMGVHIGSRFTPHVTVFKEEIKYEGGSSFTTKEGTIIGLRTELGEGTCLKIEYHSIPRLEDASVYTDLLPASDQFTADPEKDVTMYAIALDVVF